MILVLLYGLFNSLRDSLMALARYSVCGRRRHRRALRFRPGFQHFGGDRIRFTVRRFGDERHSDPDLLSRGQSFRHGRRSEAMFHAAEQRMRPMLMTALSACIGLLPAAISTGIGSQVQRPLATVIVGGMLIGPSSCSWSCRRCRHSSSAGVGSAPAAVASPAESSAMRRNGELREFALSLLMRCSSLRSRLAPHLPQKHPRAHGDGKSSAAPAEGGDHASSKGAGGKEPMGGQRARRILRRAATAKIRRPVRPRGANRRRSAPSRPDTEMTPAIPIPSSRVCRVPDETRTSLAKTNPARERQECRRHPATVAGAAPSRAQFDRRCSSRACAPREGHAFANGPSAPPRLHATTPPGPDVAARP